MTESVIKQGIVKDYKKESSLTDFTANLYASRTMI